MVRNVTFVQDMLLTNALTFSFGLSYGALKTVSKQETYSILELASNSIRNGITFFVFGLPFVITACCFEHYGRF